MEYAFDKYPPSEVTTFNVPYNYRSIMHYDSGAFSSNGQPTMISKVISKDTNCTYQSFYTQSKCVCKHVCNFTFFMQTGEPIGSIDQLQDTDIQKLKIMYNC